jgi:hypothetical protein
MATHLSDDGCLERVEVHVLGACALDEQADRVGVVERPQPPQRFALYTQRLAARGQNAYARAAKKQRHDQFGTSVKQVLTVVEEQQKLTSC